MILLLRYEPIIHSYFQIYFLKTKIKFFDYKKFKIKYNLLPQKNYIFNEMLNQSNENNMQDRKKLWIEQPIIKQDKAFFVNMWLTFYLDCLFVVFFIYYIIFICNKKTLYQDEIIIKYHIIQITYNYLRRCCC